MAEIAGIATWTEKDSATNDVAAVVHGAIVIPFPDELAGTEGEPLSAELAAGGANVVGKVSIARFSA